MGTCWIVSWQRCSCSRGQFLGAFGRRIKGAYSVRLRRPLDLQRNWTLYSRFNFHLKGNWKSNHLLSLKMRFFVQRRRCSLISGKSEQVKLSTRRELPLTSVINSRKMLQSFGTWRLSFSSAREIMMLASKLAGLFPFDDDCSFLFFVHHSGGLNRKSWAAASPWMRPLRWTARIASSSTLAVSASRPTK